MPRLKDNPLPIGLEGDGLDGDYDDDYADFLKMSEEAVASLRAEYAKTIADSTIAVTKAAQIEANKAMLEQANALTRWKWEE